MATGEVCGYTVRFLGENVCCESPQDAVTLHRVSDILNSLAPSNLTRDELAEVTAILFQYGRYKAARDLRALKQSGE